MLKFIMRLSTTMLSALLLVSLGACAGPQPQQTSSVASSADKGNLDTLEPFVVKTVYETMDTVVAVADVTKYGADATGKDDSTKAFRDALKAVEQNGGGTVWVPVGKYRITSMLKVPELITLRGDWQDPDAKNFDGNYGSVILAEPKADDSEQYGLFNLSSSSTINGLTFFYPHQDMKDIIPYPYTIYCNDVATATVENCTILNAYRGIGNAGKERLNLKNLRMTALKLGVRSVISADMGSINDISLSPKYWANATDGMNTATAKQISGWSKNNGGYGLVLHDLEQSMFANIKIEGFDCGIRFPCAPSRFMGSGPMFNVQIKDCNYGVYAEEGTYTSTWNYATDNHPVLTSIDWRYGWGITNASIEGSKYAIYNASSTVGPLSQGMFADGNTRTGYVRLCSVELKGPTYGKVLYTQNTSDDLSGYSIQSNRVTKTTGSAFEWLGEGATTDAIQASLDKVGKAGGGVVYLCPGKYEIDKQLTVPANTELRGANGGPFTSAKDGTILQPRFAGFEKSDEAENGSSMVFLDGDNAGVSGIYFMYDENFETLRKNRFSYYNYAIRGEARGVWCRNICVIAATRGIHLVSDGHVIENVYTGCVENSIVVTGKGGLILNCLGNACFLSETRVHNFIVNNSYLGLFTQKLQHITLENCVDQQIAFSFVFSARHYLVANDSQNTIVVNGCTDNTASAPYLFTGGSATVLNSIQTSGLVLYKNKDCSLKMYNTMSLHPQIDKDVKEGKNPV